MRILLLVRAESIAGHEIVLMVYTDEAITGDALVALLHSDLKDMGLSSIGHRLTILKAVYDVKVKQNIPIEADHYVPLCELYRKIIPASH
jgi:SAM domain (Sterile alpha motif)